MKITELKHGDKFKLPGQRNFRTFNCSHDLGNDEKIPADHRGKMLVILDNCRQMIVDKDEELITPKDK